MVFGQALEEMKQGEKVKLPSWSGYWYWDKDKKTVMMHTKDGEDIDIRDTKQVEYTLSNIAKDTWEIAWAYNCKEIAKENELNNIRIEINQLIEDCCNSFMVFKKSKGFDKVLNDLAYFSQKDILVDYIMNLARRAISNEQSK